MKYRIKQLKNPVLFIGLLISLAFMVVSCQKSTDELGQESFDTQKAKQGPQKEEIVVVANRNSGSISFIDAISNAVVETLSISGSQPMYVVYVPANDRIYVGDRAQNKVHVIDPASRQVESSIDVGNGVFHMWADGNGDQLWVNNDVDQTTSVIDLNSNMVIQTISIGAKPHDVFVSEDGSRAYVSVFRPDAAADQVYMYSTSTFQKTGEQDVGRDPHLYHLSRKDKLYVPCQSGEVYALDGSDLGVLNVSDYAGAHGIFGTLNQNTLFVTNLPGAEIYSINAIKDEQIGDPVSSDPVPHNLVVNKKASKLFVTHSGATANTVSVFDIGPQNGLTFNSTLTVEQNPFGLAYYQRHTNKD
jgi:YVTN family beta-propeller protein